MKVGDKVRVVDKVSCFKGREGTIKMRREGPLPWGVAGTDGNRYALVWFNDRELEVINDEVRQCPNMNASGLA